MQRIHSLWRLVVGTLNGIRIFTWYCPLRRLEMFFLTFLSVSFLPKKSVKQYLNNIINTKFTVKSLVRKGYKKGQYDVITFFNYH
jgi:hypothetical protein